jgi:hypothetical protein
MAMSWLDGHVSDLAFEPEQVHRSLEQLEERFAQREPGLRAFVLEKDRFARLRREADEALAAHLGIPEGPYLSHASEEGRVHFRETCDRLTSRYDVRPVPALADFSRLMARHHRLMAAEALQVHADWFQRFPDLYAPQTAELIKRGREIPPQQTKQDRAGSPAPAIRS